MENFEKIKVSQQMLDNINKILGQMSEKDVMEIPESNGLVLVKAETKAFKEREDSQALLYKFNNFWIATK